MDKIEKLIRSEISPDNLRKIYESLSSIINAGLVLTYESECISLIETIIEYLIYGDKSDSFIFDTFCEFNFISEFVRLSNINNKAINLQIIKSFALLITNISNKQTIYYIFSNNFINQIISTNYNKYDSDFLSYYVNFIKSLSLKMDRLTIQLFFFKQKNEFPLLDNALKLYNHSDPMIINVVRNIFLTILKTRYAPILDYICSLPCITYFNFISCRVRDCIKQINDKLVIESLDTIKYLYDEVVNDVLFFQDIFSLKIEKINYILTNCLFHYVILPLLCSCLLPFDNKKTISIYSGLNMLIVFAFYIDDEAFLNSLFAVLFSEQLHYSLKNKMINGPFDLPNYRFIMEDKKTKEKTLAQFITDNFCENFIKSIQFMSKSKYRPITDIVAKLNKLFDNQHSGINSNSEELYKIILVQLSSYFKPEETTAMSEYHHIVSVSTGISCGLTFRDEKDSAIQRLNQMFKYFKRNNDNHHSNSNSNSNANTNTNTNSNSINFGKKNKLIKNEIRESILNFFKSKDDSLILLSGLLVNIFLKKNNVISPELLSMNKLLSAEKFIKDINSIEVLSNQNELVDINLVNSDIIDSYSKDSKTKNEYNNNDTGNNSSNDINGEEVDEEIIQLSDIVIRNQSNTYKKKDGYKDITLLSFYSLNSYPKKYSVVTFEAKYFQEKFKVTQSKYSSEFIDNILSFFDSELIHRALTSRVIIEISETLMLSKENMNTEDPNLRKLNKSYITSIMDINRLLQQDAIIISQCYSLLEEEWKRYNSSLISILDSLIRDPYMLYPYQYEETLQNYPSYLKTSRTSTEKFSSFLCLFMGLNDFRVRVYQNGSIIKNSFPLKFNKKQAELNERISLKKISAIFNSKIKKGMSGSFINYSMFIIQNYLIFTTPDIKDPGYSIVKQRYPIRQLEIQGDRSEPRNLIVYSREGKNYVEIIISLEDVKTASKVKTLLEDHRRNIEKSEYVMVESYFDDKKKAFE